MKDKGVGVAGVVLDTTDEKGNQDEEAVKKAGILQEKTKAKYPFLIPDTTMMNGRLQGISAFPETCLLYTSLFTGGRCGCTTAESSFTKLCRKFFAHSIHGIDHLIQRDELGDTGQ